MPGAHSQGKVLHREMKGPPMDLAKGGPGHGKVVVVVQPFPDARAQSFGAEEIQAKA